MNSSNNKCLQKNDSLHWYVFYTKPKQEFKAEISIRNLNIESYLPVVVKKNKWSDRLKEIAEPVIRGYIFAKTNEIGRLKILEQNAISKCLYDQGKPAIIPEWQIDNLKKFLQAKSEYFISEGIVKGAKVEITSGPFTGVVGVIQSSSGKNYIAISIELINRTIIAYLPKESVEVLDFPDNL